LADVDDIKEQLRRARRSRSVDAITPEPGARPPLAHLRGGWAALQPGSLAVPLLPLSGGGVRPSD